MTLVSNSVQPRLRGFTHVHDTAVDVSELLEAKESSSMGRIIECV